VRCDVLVSESNDTCDGGMRVLENSSVSRLGGL
jgi:hypothetical protein